jgi:hypothetical protein
MPVEAGSEIEEGAGDRGDWDAVDGRSLVVGQRRAMKPHTRP